jgi:hypothetical protein
MTSLDYVNPHKKNFEIREEPLPKDKILIRLPFQTFLAYYFKINYELLNEDYDDHDYNDKFKKEINNKLLISKKFLEQYYENLKTYDEIIIDYEGLIKGLNIYNKTTNKKILIDKLDNSQYYFIDEGTIDNSIEFFENLYSKINKNNENTDIMNYENYELYPDSSRQYGEKKNPMDFSSISSFVVKKKLSNNYPTPYGYTVNPLPINYHSRTKKN